MEKAAEEIEIFDWPRILINGLPYDFLWEVVARSVFMFVLILVALLISGRRELKDLSAFELLFILALGSAAGDTMFYEDVAILPTLVVFVVIVGLYKLMTHFISVSKETEHFFEGKPICIIKDGVFIYSAVEKEELSLNEFLIDLRNESVEHLGQVRLGIYEVNGKISLLFYPKEDTKMGLPIFPEPYNESFQTIKKEGNYACTYCGTVAILKPAAGTQPCPNCEHEDWVTAIDSVRIA